MTFITGNDQLLIGTFGFVPNAVVDHGSVVLLTIRMIKIPHFLIRITTSSI